jgi:hypothetical protein
MEANKYLIDGRMVRVIGKLDTGIIVVVSVHEDEDGI